MSSEVWSYSENPSAAGEAASAAYDLAKAASWNARSIDIGGERKDIGAPGGKLLITGPHSTNLSPAVASDAIFRAAKQLAPKAILVGGTRDGREVAGRLAVKLGAGSLSEVTKLSVQGDALVGERSAFSGKVIARLSVPFPAVVTVKLGTNQPLEGGGGGGEIARFDAGDVGDPITRKESKNKEAARVDLKTAKTIVSAGRGVKKKEDLAILQGLADDLGGALGCSRPISSDLGWLPEEHHIGLTGVTVKPDLYLAVGISGQLQHIAGMKDSRVVVAINTDRDAPIFQTSDYGIVGDLYQVVPAIREILSSRRPK